MSLTFTCVGTPAGRCALPEQVPDQLWESAFAVTSPTTVAAARAAAGLPDVDVDAFDWWLRAENIPATAGAVRFEGLTVPCAVFVGNTLTVEATSMFLPVEVPVAGDSHQVVLRFGSVREWLRTRRPRGRWRSSLVSDQGLRWLRTSLIGRAQAYGGNPPPVGPWRAATAVSAPGAAIAPKLIVETDGTVHAPGATRLRIADAAGTVVATGSDSAVVTQPRLWWPRGYGPSVCYHATITVGQAVWHRTIGFRTVELDLTGGRFVLRVNGVRFFARGATWLPIDGTRLTADPVALDSVLTELEHAGATMLRVIGGGVYEEPAFYDECARRGIVVWQDAMLATFDPPAELTDLITAEFAHFLDSVAGNPAIGVLSGGSETLQQPEMLGLPADSRDLPVLDALAQCAGRHSDAPFVPSSPWSADSDLAIRTDVGVAHWFGVSGYLQQISSVRSAGIAFAAECLAFAIPGDGVSVGSAAAEPPKDRGAAWDFADVRDHYLTEVFSEDPAVLRRVNPDRYLELGRCAIIEAMTRCYAHWRAHDSGNGGALVLTAKDIRPHAGWGLIDASGSPKAPLRALARMWAPQTITVSDATLAGLRIDVHNDTADHADGTLVLVAVTANGTVAVNGSMPLSVAPHTSLALTDSDVTGVFRDLSYAYRFGTPVADAVEVLWLTPEQDVRARAVHTVVPRAHTVDAGLTLEAVETAPGRFVLDVMARTTVRYVRLDAPGFRPADDYFALAPHRNYRVPLTNNRSDGPAEFQGATAASVDTEQRAVATLRPYGQVSS